MKARVKATGEIVEISTFQDSDKLPTTYDENELEFFIPNNYWTRLEHQYAGMAMQGALANNDLLMQLLKRAKSGSRITHIAVEFANACAHTLVEKLNEKEEK